MATFMKLEIYQDDFNVPLTVSQFEEDPAYGVVLSTPSGQDEWQEFECVMLPSMAREVGKALIVMADHCEGRNG